MTTLFKQILGLFIFLFLCHNAWSQNLIPNPGFEIYATCPTGVGTGNPLNPASWLDATSGGTCDYFNECTSVWLVDVPTNLFGAEPAHGGTAYEGMMVWSVNAEYREYLQVPLLSPLVAGQFYYFSMYVSVGDDDCAIDRMGAYFSVNQPTPSGDMNNHIAVTPQIEYLLGYLNDADGWTLISGCFMAAGGEQYVTIGNFYSDGETHLDPNCTNTPPFLSYYYIDDVSLMETAPPGAIDFDLGDPLLACIQYEINPGIPGVAYTWDNGSQDTFLIVTESGNYALTITDGCATGSDSIDIEIVGTDLPVELNVDSISMCQGEVYSISLDPDAGEYEWSDGTIGPNIDISTTGLYTITLNDDDCDITSDQIMVTVIDPPSNFSLGPDTYLCFGDQLEFSFDPDLGEFMWQDGSSSPDYTIDDDGTFSLTISNSCGSAYADVEINQLVTPSLTFIPDSFSLCTGDTLDIVIDPGMGDFHWQDGSTNSNYQVLSPGVYAVTVDNFCGTDEADFTVSPLPDPVVNFGPDLLICQSQLPILLNAGSTAGDVYLWQDGSAGSQLLVDSAGTFSVTVTNACSSVSDLIQISVQSPILEVTLPPDQLICSGDSIVILNSGDSGNFTWQDNSNADTLLVITPGTYSLTVNTLCGSGSDTVVIGIWPPISVPDLGADVSLCPGEQLVLSPNISGVSFLWQDASTADTLVVSAAGTYYVQVTDQCTSASDTIEVSINNNPPQLSLPAQFNLCQGDTITLEAGIGGVSYLWNDNSQSSTLTVFTAGTYSLTVSNACGTDAASVSVLDAGPGPSVSLGNDVQLCPGDLITLSLIYAAVSTWLWSDGSSLDSYTVSGNELVTVTVTNSCGVSFDTLVASLLPATPPIDLGADTSLCPGNMLLLTVNTPNVSVEWSDGSVNNQLVVDSSGEYFATISNACGENVDTINVGILPPAPVLDLGIDQSLCPGEVISLDPGLINVTYLWQDGSTSSSFSATQAGIIILSVANACGADADTLEITESTEGPQVNLGNDVTACEGDVITLMSDISGVNYLWQDGSTSPTFSTSSSGAYVLQVSNNCGADTDTIQVNLLSAPATFDLGPDTTLCPGESILLLAPSTTSTIQWQDGSNSPSFLADKAQTYSLTLSNNCGSAQDELALDFDQRIPDVHLDPVYTWCPGILLTLDATQLIPVTYQWSTGDHSPTIAVDKAGLYSVDIQAPCASVHDETEVMLSDTCFTENSFFVPNVFSPNDDGINDVFTIGLSEGIEVISVQAEIFDRWGNMVFQSFKTPFQWDGKFDGTPMNPGVYIYSIEVSYFDQAVERKGILHGDITLIR